MMGTSGLILTLGEAAGTAAAQLADAPGGLTARLIPLMALLCMFCGFALAMAPRENEKGVKLTALVISTLVFLISLVVAFSFDWTRPGAVQMLVEGNWVPTLGVKFSMGVDSISLWLILLTTFLMPLTILGSFGDLTGKLAGRAREFYLWLLVLEGALIAVFAAQDLILFFIGFEMTLVPLFFLIGIFGGAQRRVAAVKFFIFTLAGSVFTFAAVIYVAYFQMTRTGNWTFDIGAITKAAGAMSASEQNWVLLGLFIGFAVKVPLFPVHIWLPLAHTEAPTSGSVILAGVLLKLGTYGLLRFALPMAPEAVLEHADLIGVFAVVGIIYAALICWVQTDIKKLIAYSSVSHLGFCVLGLFALNQEGIGGSVIYMINHGLSTGALFLCVGMIYTRYHTRQMDDLSGLGKRLPVWSTFMVFFCFASVGLPGLNGFVGEFLTILGAFSSTRALGIMFAAFASLGLILGAIYILYMLGKVVMGPVKEPEKYAGKVSDLNFRECFVLTPLAVACLVLGLYPTPMLKSFEEPIDGILSTYKQIETKQAETAGEGKGGGVSMRRAERQEVSP